ncbi:TVP38/TMEM64 family protein [Pseudonocardia sp. TRM90224]|uniref:TVP38/TMEM64 family protein n=1 Tax=Pseudonocardia sp. TRM90224 TaxID=2812678 RepID=UPI001E422EC3|nr:TVP38/TMEM64 family protein [Pseudonocardia sp. TRM90224]
MNWGRIAVGAVVAAAIAATVGVVVWSGETPDIRASVQAAGLWAPLLFVVLQAVVNITPLPRTVFTVAAGVLFGSVAGFVLTVVATTLAACLAFWLVRYMGGAFVERHSHRAGLAWLRARLDRSGLLAVLSIRLVPMVPFAVLNYAAGLSGVRFLPYLIATVLGVLPGTIAIVVLGDAVIGGDPPFALVIVSVVSAVVGLVGAIIAARKPALVGAPEEPAVAP